MRGTYQMKRKQKMLKLNLNKRYLTFLYLWLRWCFVLQSLLLRMSVYEDNWFFTENNWFFNGYSKPAITIIALVIGYIAIFSRHIPHG